VHDLDRVCIAHLTSDYFNMINGNNNIYITSDYTSSFINGLGQINLQADKNQLLIINQATTGVASNFQPKIRIGTDYRVSTKTNYRNNTMIHFENTDLFINGRWFDNSSSETIDHGQYFKYTNCGYGYKPRTLAPNDYIYRYYNFMLLEANSSSYVYLTNYTHYLDTSSELPKNRVGWSCKIINTSSSNWTIQSVDTNFFVSSSGSTSSKNFYINKNKSVELTLIYIGTSYYWLVHQFA